ncbi:MAG: glycoside hydrolase family 38 C-terminal domain-containing protein, partial [bacterium]
SYTMVHAQLGEALATADEVLHFGLRRRMNELEDNSKQRLVAFNASRQVFDDFVEFEPWREYAISVPRLRLLNAAGDMVPHQRLDAEPLTPFTLRLLVPMRQMQPQELRELRIDLEPPADVNKPISGFGSVGFEVSQIHNDRGAAVNLDGSGKIDLPGLPMRLPLPRLHLIEDPTDTWSHGIDRYADAPAEQPTWEPAEVIERGPLRATLLQRGRIGRSSLRAFWRVYGDSGFIELLLEVDWHERNKVLKWVVVPATSIVRRFEGIPEGQLSRTGDGRELPLRDRTLLELAGGHRLGVVCPDVFALDGTGSRLRLTLLRSALFAHHQPHTGVGLSAQVADAGLHRFRFRLAAGADLTGQQLDEQAWALQRPPALAELTRGMPPGVNQGVYNDPIRPPIDPD